MRIQTCCSVGPKLLGSRPRCSPLGIAAKPTRTGRALLLPRAAAAAIALPAPDGRTAQASHTSSSAASSAQQHPAHHIGQGPPPLPPPPVTGRLVDVVPYLLRLALAEKKLMWRVALAMTCMVISKMAGEAAAAGSMVQGAPCPPACACTACKHAGSQGKRACDAQRVAVGAEGGGGSWALGAACMAVRHDS